MTATGLDSLDKAYQALDHIAHHGWGKGAENDGRPLKSKSSGDGITHDPKALERLNALKAEITEATGTALRGEKPKVVIRNTNVYFSVIASTYNLMAGDQERIERYDSRLERMAYSVNCWLDDRDTEVNGCTPPKDCTRHDLNLGKSRPCVFLGAGGCEMGRR